MLKIHLTTRFLKDVKKAKKQHLDLNKLDGVILRLSHQLPLEKQFCDHKLKGKFCGYTDCRECHIEPDWILIYKIDNGKLELLILRTGTHSELFRR